MTNLFCSEGLVTASLLIICSSAYLARVPRLKTWFFSQKRGGYKGLLYKAQVIGIRLHWAVSLCCFGMAVYLLLLK